MTFRSLNKNDIDLILSIQKDNFPDGWNETQILSGFYDYLLTVICLEVDGKAVGFISYSLPIDIADIEGLVVISSERNKGYGKMLLEYALDELKAKKVQKVLLEVRESNIPAINLYKSCGFNEISVRKKYYSDGENAIVMIKEI